MELSQQQEQDLFESCESAKGLEAKVGELVKQGLDWQKGLELVRRASDYYRQVPIAVDVAKAKDGRIFVNVKAVTVGKNGMPTVNKSHYGALVSCREDNLIPSIRAIKANSDKIVEEALKLVVAFKSGQETTPTIL